MAEATLGPNIRRITKAYESFSKAHDSDALGRMPMHDSPAASNFIEQRAKRKVHTTCISDFDSHRISSAIDKSCTDLGLLKSS